MSGGLFDYSQYYIADITDTIEGIVGRNDSKQDEHDPHYVYSPKIIEAFTNGIHALKVAEVYAQRIDWLVSGDDGEDTFFCRLEEGLAKLKDDNLEVHARRCQICETDNTARVADDAQFCCFCGSKL